MTIDDVSGIDIEQLKKIHDWQNKYRLITQWSNLISEKAELRQEKNLIKGCEAKAWIGVIIIQGYYHFSFDSDSRIIKGLAAILLSVINNKTAEQIADLDYQNLLIDLGIAERLAPSRSNGFFAIIKVVFSMIKK